MQQLKKSSNNYPESPEIGASGIRFSYGTRAGRRADSRSIDAALRRMESSGHDYSDS